MAKSCEPSLQLLHQHLQDAVDLEFWTIPFYMSAMYSIKDRSLPEYQRIRTVINQEMLHLQCAANMANAYGLSSKFTPPVYEGTTIPHLDFNLDNPDVIKPYTPYSAEIGPLDELRVNGMCLVEIPDYETDITHWKKALLFATRGEYGSIGAFYRALRRLAYHCRNDIKGGVRQVDYFKAFYNNMPNMTITESGDVGFQQVELLIDLITEQGEGECKAEPVIPPTFQNTADDTEPENDHFAKFNEIKNDLAQSSREPCWIYQGKPRGEYCAKNAALELILIEQFAELCKGLEGLFSGENPQQFFPVMASVGAAVRNCWEHGVTPKFS